MIVVSLEHPRRPSKHAAKSYSLHQGVVKHVLTQHNITFLQVFLQYNGVSAWVPASFAVPTLLPKISLQSIKQLGKKKSKEQTDKEFRQVGALLRSHCLLSCPGMCN
jgi:hypothetical protein